MSSLLTVECLRTEFPTSLGVLNAVDGVSFTLNRGEVLGLVGESGCGKSVTSLSIMRLVPWPGRIAGGRILFEGEDLLGKDDEAMRAMRGARIGMVFQEPMTSLNPVFSIGDQIAAVVLAHGGTSRRAAWDHAVAMLELVQMPSAGHRARDFPHELSGGLRQRAMIALALVAGPALLIADEPTTALDVTIQAQVLDLMRELKKQYTLALLLITHDFGVIAEMADRVAVMYKGRLVEEGPVRQILREPRHEYTQGLLAAIPGMPRPRSELRSAAPKGVR